jgi:D-arabinose 1-dehydrogenase-like Zn-dependent alcohol dehydrogenase
MPEATWKPHEKNGRLTMQSDLPDSVYAFPKQRKEPLTDAQHVRNAIARFDQVIDVSDADRALAREHRDSCKLLRRQPRAAEALPKLGGAQAILATAPSSKAMSELIDGLATNGKLIVIGVVSDPIQAVPLQLIVGTKNIEGTAAGTPADEEDTINFAELTGLRPMIETYPLEGAGDAYARMMSGKTQFRVVLTM